MFFWPRLGNPFVCHWSLFVSFSGLYIYYLFVWSNLNFLHISQWITLPIQSCLVSYSCVNLLHSLIIWLTILFVSLHLLFCCVLSILALIWLVLMALFLLLLKEILFLSKGCLFLTRSRFSRVGCCLLIVQNVHWVVFLPIFVF